MSNMSTQGGDLAATCWWVCWNSPSHLAVSPLWCCSRLIYPLCSWRTLSFTQAWLRGLAAFWALCYWGPDRSPLTVKITWISCKKESWLRTLNVLEWGQVLKHCSRCMGQISAIFIHFSRKTYLKYRIYGKKKNLQSNFHFAIFHQTKPSNKRIA